MKLLRRVKISITRQYGKTVILLLMTIILGAVLSAAISANHAVSNTHINLRRSLPPIVGFSTDAAEIANYIIVEDDMVVYHPEVLAITLAMMQEIQALPYVSHYYHTSFTRFYGPDISHYIPPNASDLANSWQCHWEDFGRGDQHCFSLNNIFIFLSTSADAPIEMQTGQVTLIAGRDFTNYQNYVTDGFFPVMVSTEFAQQNNFDVGSTFTMRDDRQQEFWWGWYEYDPTRSNHYQFEIIGLFNVTPQNYVPNNRDYQRDAAQLLRVAINRIYTPSSTIAFVNNRRNEIIYELATAEVRELWREEWSESPRFDGFVVLNDPLYLDDFRIAVAEILPQFWQVDDLNNAFADFASSMTVVDDLFDTVLWVAVGATLIVLVMLIMLFLSDRRTEIGIYLALGEKRSKISLQIMTELLVVAVVGITIALGIGNVIADNISRDLVINELARIDDERVNLREFINFWEVSLDNFRFTQRLAPSEAIEMFDTSLSVSTVLVFYGVGLGITTVATGVSVLWVAKANPKKILMNGKIQ